MNVAPGLSMTRRRTGRTGMSPGCSIRHAGQVQTYRLRPTGTIGVLLPALPGLLLTVVGLDAVLRAGGALAWVLLSIGVGWTALWLRLPWAVRLAEPTPTAPATVTLLGPLRHTTIAASDIASVTGRWTGGMNRWFLSSVWVDLHHRTVGFPLPVGFADPEAVRDHLLSLNPGIQMSD